MSRLLERIGIVGVIKNHSSKILWVVEGTTTPPKNYATTAHKLYPNMKSPKIIDADGFRRYDNKSIEGHSAWWKIRDIFTADIYDCGSGVDVKVTYKEKVKIEHFGSVFYDNSGNWGEPIQNVIKVKKDVTKIISHFLVDNIGWITKNEAIKLAKQGKIDNVVIVNSKKHGAYLRSNPDHQKENNFSNMA